MSVDHPQAGQQPDNSFVKAFLPGLIVGLLVGLAVGAFALPLLDRETIPAGSAAPSGAGRAKTPSGTDLEREAPPPLSAAEQETPVEEVEPTTPAMPETVKPQSPPNGKPPAPNGM